ncbi:unnamed protein product [Nyctereutes procyonoides]|uniref:(raccoon dog) hypothetical protein n=1 Tax=Nyctereutes procyonoides TaxID=34880 RepID=A0A811YTY7_NYCPR|nr:unnamed protein product [Nyctereutes procyonoides]
MRCHCLLSPFIYVRVKHRNKFTCLSQTGRCFELCIGKSACHI